MFDIGFTRFITTTWISFIWTVLVILAILACIVAVFGGPFVIYNSMEVWTGTTAMLMGPIVMLLGLLVTALFLLFTRMGLELAIVFFRVETNTRETKECLREIKEQLVKSK